MLAWLFFWSEVVPTLLVTFNALKTASYWILGMFSVGRGKLHIFTKVISRQSHHVTVRKSTTNALKEKFYFNFSDLFDIYNCATDSRNSFFFFYTDQLFPVTLHNFTQTQTKGQTQQSLTNTTQEMRWWVLLHFTGNTVISFVQKLRWRCSLK